MALPTRTNLLTLDYSENGSPFCNIASKSGISLDGLDYSENGSPFWGLPVTVTTTNDVFAWMDGNATQDIFGMII